MSGVSMAVAQIISTTWSKRSRGAPLAALRNNVPEQLALPLPRLALPPRQREPLVTAIHRVAYGEQNAFSAPLYEQVITQLGAIIQLTPALELHHIEDSSSAAAMLQVVFESSYPPQSVQPCIISLRMGAPQRNGPHHPFALQPGEWGRIRFMGRWTVGYEGYTSYEKWVYNIAHVSAPPPPRMFLDTEPHRRYESMPDVW